MSPEQARHPARGRIAANSARSFVHTSHESSDLRIFEPAPTRNFSASGAAIDDTRFTAEFKIPAVSQVSAVPRGDSGKTQARHGVYPVWFLKYTSYLSHAAVE